MNVNGIAQRIKRKKVFTYFKTKKPSIVFMQETHSSKNDETTWPTEWSGPIYMSHGQTNSKGVAIALSKDMNIIVNKVTADQNGRFLIIDAEIQDTMLTLINVYVPNDDNPEFFRELFEAQGTHCNKNIVLSRDFNLTMNQEVDCTNPERVNNDKALSVLKLYINELMLEFVWRIKHPHLRQYSWSKQKPKYTASRIDFFLINYGILAETQCKIVPGCSTNHSLIDLTLNLNKSERGKGYWKLNTHHLLNPEYVSHNNSVIEDTIFAFSYQQPDEKWEVMKHKIIKVSKSWSKSKARDNAKSLHQIIKKIDMLTRKLNENVHEQNDILNNINHQKQKLDSFMEYQTKGSIVRAYYKWYSEGKTGSKYFLNLEKVRYSNKTIKTLINKDQKIVKDQKAILAEQYKYYKKLYTSDPSVYFAYINESNCKLSDHDHDSLENKITLSEVATAIKKMKDNSAPGSDGLPVEFYKVFFASIGTYLYKVLRYAIDVKGELHESARSGILVLIPKKGKSPEYLTNWRPLTLMNIDHKVLAKVLAIRI